MRLDVYLSPQQVEWLERLRETGLYGTSLSATARTLIARGIQEGIKGGLISVAFPRKWPRRRNR